MMTIPKSPDLLRLSIARLWNGAPCPDPRLGAMVEMTQTDSGVLLRSLSTVRENARIPDAPVGSRVDRLWETDVAELFFVDEDGQYLEVEIGVGGHYLVLGFDAPRHLVADFADLAFKTRHEQRPDGSVVNEITIPSEMFPMNLKALNAYVIVGNQFLAYHPLPGTEPDFHQPDVFPFARVAA